MKTRLRRSIRIFEGEMTSFLTENGQNACFVAYLKREFDADYFSLVIMYLHLHDFNECNKIFSVYFH